MPFAHEPADHAEIDRPLAASLPAAAIAMPVAPQECIDIPVAEPVDSLGHLALEGEPPHFAVGHDVKARSLLQRDGLIDGAILYGLELRVSETAGHPGVPGFAQCNRPEKTADNVGMCRNHRTARLRFQSGVLAMRPVDSTNQRSLLKGLPLSRATSQSATKAGGKGPRLAAGTFPTECRLSA